MFITFEGPDGCGKSTQATLLAEHLEQLGYTVFLTREPGGTSIGDQIRTVLLDNLDNQDMHPRTEILLFSASRAQHVEEAIRPALKAGPIVISDRFYDSTLAYQGHGRGLDLEALRQITRFATGGLAPDLTVYIDIEVEVGLERCLKDGRGHWNRLDQLDLGFHRRVRAGYQALLEAEPGRWVTVEGNRPVDAVQSDVRQIVLERLQAAGRRPPASSRAG
jgi:dTMP kinase